MNSNPLTWQAKPMSDPLQQAVQSQLSSLALAALTPAQLAQIEHLVACSSFAGRVLLQQPELIPTLLNAEPIAQLQLTTDATEAQVMSQLRRHRNAVWCKFWPTMCSPGSRSHSR